MQPVTDAGLILSARHAVAVAKPTVHQELDDFIVVNPLNGDLLATALVNAAAIHDALVSHFADAGATAIVDAPHRLADAGAEVAALIAAGHPADQPGLIAWIALAKAALIAHGNRAGVHFTNDAGAGGTGFALAHDPPVSVGDCNDDLASLKTGYNTHVDLASLL
ncbi:MAG TPA: hypothetical protein VKP14_10120 [Gaiellaceae bacterium]|nr:hypothetical protein [Gaiellaceae bacterium]